MNKNITLIISSFLFSLLFYQKQLGLNYVLFSLLALLLFWKHNSMKFSNKKVLFFAICYLSTSSLVFLYNSGLALISSIVCFFILLGTITETRSSIYIQFLNGFFSTIAASFSNYFNKLKEETAVTKKRKTNYLYWFKIIGIPLVVVLIFIILYRSANPYFDQIIRSIDFSFINLQWVLFTVLGYFLLLNITNPLAIEPSTKLDLKIANNLNQDELKPQTKTSIIQENQLGVVLLLLLNFLIVIFLITDTIYLLDVHKDLTAPSLSKSVHEGIYALITSIVFAVGIILYFFRGNLNFYEKNKNLKALTIIWISLNIMLVFITAYKNYLYISYYGFTYKRIGVLVYLLLSLAGLITTFLKVKGKYNLWYLFRKNISIAFSILIISSIINWDALITHYNTVHAKTTDLYYLIRLSDNNAFLLKYYADRHPDRVSISQKKKIDIKYQFYTKYLAQNTWQEFVYDNLKLEE